MDLCYIKVKSGFMLIRKNILLIKKVVRKWNVDICFGNRTAENIRFYLNLYVSSICEDADVFLSIICPGDADDRKYIMWIYSETD